MLLVSIQEFCAPEFLIGKQIILGGVTARKRQPLHVIRYPDVVGRWKIQAGMRGGGGYDCRQMLWKFLCRCPLIEACVRTAPHGHLTVTEWLPGQPLDHVVSVARFICEWLKFAGGIAATANIDERECITV